MNPLFTSWLKEWTNEYYKSTNPCTQKLYWAYKRATENMNKYPEILPTGLDAVKVPYVGKGISERLEKRRLEGVSNSGDNSIDIQNIAVAAEPVSISVCETQESIPTKRKTARKPKAYIPAYRSGAYAIIITLFKHTSSSIDFMTKYEIIDRAQEHCDFSFTASDSTSHSNYTAWSSIKLLLQKDLVYKAALKYCLTDDGRELGYTLNQLSMKMQSQDAVSEPPSTIKISELSNSTLENEPLIRFIKYSFDIIFIIDTREIRNRGDRSFFKVELGKLGVQVESRSLDLGDSIWIARERNTGIELVLDYLIERKTMADLVSSIKDGRYKEQKFRQRKCGIRNIVYLVEDTHMSEAKSFGWGAIQSALAQIQVREGFFLKRVSTSMDAVEYLFKMNKLLNELYKEKELVGVRELDRDILEDFMESDNLMTFECFSNMNTKSKSMTIQDCWTRQLMTIRGISAEKASKISNQFPTCASFMSALSSLSEKEREECLHKSNDCKPLGKANAKKVIQIFLSDDYD